MVCPRCVMVVRKVLEDLGLNVQKVELGEAYVEANEEISLLQIDEKLKQDGFELLQGKDQLLTEKVKTHLINYVQQLEDHEEAPKLSEYLPKKMHQNYSSLSSTFSEYEDITIEKYVIHLKIERIKELLSHNELTLSEMAYKLNYSSVAHLSSQFKKVTGMSPTDYKKARDSFRKPLEDA